MLVYILKFSACLCIFLAFYKLFLERENMHQFKRFYLIGILFISIIIPLITFTEYIEPQPVLDSFSTASLLPADIVSVAVEESTNYLPTILWSIYGLGVLLFGLKFGHNLALMILKIKKNPKQKKSNFINVLLKDLVTPHTFFSYIFLNKHKYETHQIPQEVLLHEQTHAKQKHSLDVLFIEVLQIIFWFNPLVYFIKNSIKLNHEFLADNAVLNKGIQANNYQNILLSFSSHNQDASLANAINYSSIKKRLTVMKTHTSKTKMWLRSLILLPLLALTLYSFSERKEVIKEIEETEFISEIQGNNNLTLKFPDKDTYYKNVKFQLTDSSGNTTTKTYDELTSEEKAKLMPVPKVPQKNPPSNTQLSDWLDSKQFGIWLDGNRIENNELSNYNVSDFSMYNVSKLEKNAINYGKHYFQVNISSHSKYNELYKDGIQPLNNGVLIKIMSHENESIKQDGASREQMKEYERLAKHYNSLSKDQLIIKKKDLERMKYIYHLMSDKQKKDTEPFPVFPPPPAPPAPDAKEPVNPNSPPQPQEPNWLLINSKGQLLYNDDFTTLKTLESKLESLSKNSDAVKVVSIKFHEDAPKEMAKKVLELMTKYNIKVVKVYDSEARKDIPPPPPIPEKATEAQKKKYEEAIKHYKLSTQKNEQVRVKELKKEKLASQEARLAKIKTEKGELTQVRVLTKEESTKLKKEKEAYKNKQKLELAQVREVKSAEVEKLKKEKLAYQEAREAKIKTEKRELAQVKELRKKEDVQKLREEKLAYAEAQKAKLSTEERLVRVREIEHPKPPKSPLDHVIEMAKKDAVFYLEGKEISSDIAIETLKKNKSLNIQTLDKDSKQPKVYISKKPIVIED